MKKNTFCIFLLFLLLPNAKGQTVNNVDDQLVIYLGNIKKLHNDTSQGFDSLWGANNKLENFIETACSKLAWDTKFPKAEKNGLSIVASSDHKLQLFSWDTWTGGTQHRYSSILTVKTENGILFSDVNNLFQVTIDGDDTVASAETYAYYKIAAINTKDNAVTYLFFGEQDASNEKAEQIFAGKIISDKLVKVPFFKTATKTLSSIDYYYNLLAFREKNRNIDLPSIHLNNDGERLYIPIITDEAMTSKYLVYIFDGNNYVFDKNAK